MKRLEVSNQEFAWDRVSGSQTVPVIPWRRVFGLAIAPESEVRAVRIAYKGEHGAVLIEGAPLTFDQPLEDVRVLPLDYTTGELVLMVAETPADLAHLPTHVANRARIALHGDLRARVVRLHRPRGVNVAVCRYVIATTTPDIGEFATAVSLTVREVHLNADQEDGQGAVRLTLGTHAAADGVSERAATQSRFTGDVLEIEVNNYDSNDPAYPLSLVVSLSGHTIDPDDAA